MKQCSIEHKNTLIKGGLLSKCIISLRSHCHQIVESEVQGNVASVDRRHCGNKMSSLVNKTMKRCHVNGFLE